MGYRKYWRSTQQGWHEECKHSTRQGSCLSLRNTSGKRFHYFTRSRTGNGSAALALSRNVEYREGDTGIRLREETHCSWKVRTSIQVVSGRLSLSLYVGRITEYFLVLEDDGTDPVCDLVATIATAVARCMDAAHSLRLAQGGSASAQNQEREVPG